MSSTSDGIGSNQIPDQRVVSGSASSPRRRIAVGMGGTEIAVSIISVVERPWATRFDRSTTTHAPRQACGDEAG
jgi:hypothetical protein